MMIKCYLNRHIHHVCEHTLIQNPMWKHTKLVKSSPFAKKHAQRKRTMQFANVIINEFFEQKNFFLGEKGSFWIIVNLTNIAIFEKTSPHIQYHKIEGKKKTWVYNGDINSHEEKIHGNLSIVKLWTLN